MTKRARPRTAERPPWSVRAARRTLRGTPPPRHEVARETDLAVPAADGVPLLTDHYFPLADQDFPTLLVRSPYGRGFPWAALYGLAFAEQGFHVVLQSCRGTGGSGGDFTPWRDEAADGHATVAWLRGQEWFNGSLGTVGASYFGYAQWALALDPPPELRAMAVQVGVHDPHDFFYGGGAFGLEKALIAATGIVHQSRGAGAFVRATMRLRRRLRRAVRSLPLVEAYVPAIGERVPFLEEAMTRPDAGDPHWDGADAGAAAERSTVPTCLVSGWSDVQLDQTMRQYARLRRAGCETALLVGPWTHTAALGQGWPEAFGQVLPWMRRHLSGDGDAEPPARVRVHVGGENAWRDLPDWPADPPTELWHTGDGGTLVKGGSPHAAPVRFRYDPADPTPSVGGPGLSAKAGPRDNRGLEARADVLTFTGAPLAEPLEVVGPVRAEVRVETSTGHGDVFARLCDVDAEGRSTNVCDGLLRLPPGTSGPVQVTVDMSAAAHRFAAGHRLRLQISGGAHPRFARNTGTGEPFATTTALVPADITVHPPTALVLPR
ncbi:CocE/NonD family hydrolase [Spirillospora sp. CA-253888]